VAPPAGCAPEEHLSPRQLDGASGSERLRNVKERTDRRLPLTQNTHIVHSQIAELVTPFIRMLQPDAAYLLWNTVTPSGIAALNAEVTRQASIIAYADDFKFLFFLTLSGAVLVFCSCGQALRRWATATRRSIDRKSPSSVCGIDADAGFDSAPPACCNCRKTEPITATDAKQIPAGKID
jgi:hypothetical protein